jgi:hypothetical protein
MVSEPHDWTVPAPLRALLWWPPLAFFVVLLDPSAAAGTIAATGAALAVLGTVGTAVGHAFTRRRASRASDAPTVTTARPAGSAVPVAVEQRAA